MPQAPFPPSVSRLHARQREGKMVRTPPHYEN
uniref:Uncharacterized protein n=1 Tax=Anguilla anguilla TaxID=7936 RepID=A0A0E9U0A5_ANGAN